MELLLTVVHVVACVVIVLFIVLQSGRGGAGGAMFGGGGGDSVFGGAGPANFLVKVTAGTAVLFFVTSVLLTAVGSKDTGSLVDRIDVADATGQDDANPVVAPATFAGSVSTDSGEAIAATVEVVPGPDAVATLADGTFSLSVENPDRHVVNVVVPGYVPLRTNVNLRAGIENNRDFIVTKAVGPIRNTDTGIAVDPISFSSGTSDIEAASTAALDVVAQYLFTNPDVSVRVEVHSDNAGASEASMTLTQGQAESVVAYLTGLGISADRLEAKGFGDTQPIASNDTENGRAENRRVAFTVR